MDDFLSLGLRRHRTHEPTGSVSCLWNIPCSSSRLDPTSMVTSRQRLFVRRLKRARHTLAGTAWNWVERGAISWGSPGSYFALARTRRRLLSKALVTSVGAPTPPGPVVLKSRSDSRLARRCASLILLSSAIGGCATRQRPKELVTLEQLRSDPTLSESDRRAC